jgi:hypothetical protein
MDFIRRAKNLARLGKPKPIWYDTVTRNIIPHNSTRNSLVRNNAIGKPAPIRFLEDRLRINFHSKFPLEALRPTVFRVELEDLPEDSIEFAIKRQACLMEEYGIAEEEAYAIAEKEFLTKRMRAEVEQRVAREMAQQIYGPYQHEMYNNPLGEALRYEKRVMA